MNSDPELEAFHPGALRAIPEDVGVAAPMRQRAEIGVITRHIERVVSGGSIPLRAEPGTRISLCMCVRGEREGSEIAVPEERGIDDLGGFEIEVLQSSRCPN